MSGLQFYIADIETNGLKVGFHECCELSIIRAKDKMQLTRKIKVDNWKNSSYDALVITGKTIESLRQGDSKQKTVEDVDSFIKEDGLTSAHRVLVGHNIINFDKKFLHHMWEQQGKEFQIDLFLDTIPLSKRLAAQIGQPKAKVKLESALDLFGIKKVGKMHSAKGDSRNTYLLWKHLMDSNVEYIDLIKQFPHRINNNNDNEDVEELEDFEVGF